MKPKSKTQPQARRVTVGRQVRQLPQPISTGTDAGFARAQLTKSLDREAKLREQLKQEREAHAAQIAQRVADERHDSLVIICSQQADARGLDAKTKAKFIAAVLAKDPGTAGDVYRVMKEELHALGASANPPAPTGQNPLDQRLPPPPDASLGMVSGSPGLMGARAEHAKRDPQRAERVQAAQEHAERERIARERYRENLRRRGLQDPSVFSPCG